MLTKEQIEDIVKQKINEDEHPGEAVGGSGHLGYKSVDLKAIETKVTDDDTIEVTYEYIITVETEFTFYPDNPPMEYPCRKTIRLNSKGMVVTSHDDKSHQE